MTSLFVSHGAPTFALEPGQAGPALSQLERNCPDQQRCWWCRPTG